MEKLIWEIILQTQLKLEFNKMGWEIIGMHAIPVHGSLARMLIYANAI